jgi:hypothetical protein
MIKEWESKVVSLEKEYFDKLNNWVSLTFTQTREGYQHLSYDNHNEYVYPPSSLPFLGHLRFKKEEYSPLQIIIQLSIVTGEYLYYLAATDNLKEIGVIINE